MSLKTISGLLKASILAVLLLCASSPSLFAQTSQGILTGVSRDATGAVVGKTKVTVTNEDTGEVRETVAKSDGAYRLDAIPPGRYTLVFESPGLTGKRQRA